MHSWKRTLPAVVALVAFAAAGRAQDSLKSPAMGNPKIKSIEAISFGPKGLLLIGDGKGKQLVAVQTGDTKAQAWKKTEIDDIKKELAGRLGTTAKGIEILKLAVNPDSHTAYIAVRS